MTAGELRRGHQVKVESRWRKVVAVYLLGDVVSVSFANGDSIRWQKGFAVEAK